MKTYTNPVFENAPDPWVYRQGPECYYFIRTTGVNLELMRSRTLTGIGSEERKIIWEAPKEGSCCHNIWAPELHRIDGVWYIYFSGDDYKGTTPDDYGIGHTTRTGHVLVCRDADPMTGAWELAGKTGCDPVGIDGTIVRQGEKLYFVYAAYENFPTTVSSLYIYEMESPLRVKGKPVCIARAEYDWEIASEDPSWKILEGPAALYRNGKIFLAYSANTCWTDNYCLGMLTADANADLMDPKSWKKSPEPVFRKCMENKAYGPGHNSFTLSPDGAEDYLVYHLITDPYNGEGGRARHACIQKFTWREDGTPDFGKPAAPGEELPLPSGEK